MSSAMRAELPSLDLTLNGARLCALPSGALHWPDEGVLVVSDLHLGKSERMARRGGSLLPPYETMETLAKLDADLDATRPARVICLGDSFDDLAAAQAMAEETRLWLARQMAGRDWIWIEGNHDAGPVQVGGTHRASLTVGPLTFCHIARPGAQGEVSGHYHPKLRLQVRGRRVSRRCFVASGAKLILPAFGALTGGLDASHKEILRKVGTPATALIPIKDRLLSFPLAA